MIDWKMLVLILTLLLLVDEGAAFSPEEEVDGVVMVAAEFSSSMSWSYVRQGVSSQKLLPAIFAIILIAKK
jgi:hypothetical protein